MTPPATDAFEVVYPIKTVGDRREPFPTIYWLLDRAISVRLSELERYGHVGLIEQQLAADPQLMQRYHDDHVWYRQQRWSMLTTDDRAWIEASPSWRRSFDAGIAGIAKLETVKCLHAQWAYHLAAADRGGTTVGQLIEAVL